METKTYRITRVQPISHDCFVCGEDNSFGVHCQFLETDTHELIAISKPAFEHQSYPHRMHGGVIAALLDESIGRAVNIDDPDAFGVTMSLSIKYRKPTPLEEPFFVVARIVGQSHHCFEGTAEIVLPDGTVTAEAAARYMQLPIETIAQEDQDNATLIPDTRPAPQTVTLPLYKKRGV